MCDDCVHNEAVQVKDTKLSWNIENLAVSHDSQEFLQASEFENIQFTVPKSLDQACLETVKKLQVGIRCFELANA